jgi:hypothetical protein
MALAVLSSPSRYRYVSNGSSSSRSGTPTAVQHQAGADRRGAGRSAWALGGLCEKRGGAQTVIAAASGNGARFSISFDRWYGVVSSLLGLPPSTAYVKLGGAQVEVRMGWAFRSRFPRSAVVATSALDIRSLSRGVHGFGGRWLVNGSGRGILRIHLSPIQRAYVMGVPVRLRELLVSVSDWPALAAAFKDSI